LGGCSLGWVIGDSIRARRRYIAALEERAERLERERAAEAARAAAEEQARIARELHDVLAHNVSVMVVQAAAANDVFDSQPERAREALKSIEATGRDALAELRRLLGIVRGDGAGYAPQPSLDRLDELVDHVRSAGLAVAVTIEGEPRELPAGIDLSAYRVVQEALTNTIKHAQASQAEVALRFRRDGLDVEVRDDGVGAGNGDGGGNGLIGMRERVAVYGGAFTAGSDPGRWVRRPGRVPARGLGMSIRILVADDQPLVRSGFRMVLDGRSDLELVGEAGDGLEALRLSRELDPDVILMDVRMPNMDGVEATR